MRVPGDEDVDIQLSLEQRQAGHVAPGDHLVAVDEADLKLAHCDHLLLRVVQVLRGNIRKVLCCTVFMYRLNEAHQAVTSAVIIILKGCPFFWLLLKIESRAGETQFARREQLQFHYTAISLQ